MYRLVRFEVLARLACARLELRHLLGEDGKDVSLFLQWRRARQEMICSTVYLGVGTHNIVVHVEMLGQALGGAQERLERHALLLKLAVCKLRVA